VSKSKRTATVEMEEGYMQLTVDYTDSSDRAIICDTIGKVEKELNVHPEVVHKRSEQGGTFAIEFSEEIYVHSRIPGEFVENLLSKLEIHHCQDK